MHASSFGGLTRERSLPKFLGRIHFLAVVWQSPFFFFFSCHLEAKDHSQFPETSFRSLFYGLLHNIAGFPSKESACSAGNLVSFPGLGRSPGEGNGNPLQYSCLENPIDRGAWWAVVHWVTKSWACSLEAEEKHLLWFWISLTSSFDPYFFKELAWLDQT